MPGRFPGQRGQHAGVEIVPEAVREAREAAGLTQAALAEPQFTRAAIYQVEAGKARPSKRLLRQIARRTGRSESSFLVGAAITEEQRRDTGRLHKLFATAEFETLVTEGEGLLAQDLPASVEAERRFLVGGAYVRSGDGQGAYPHLVRARKLLETTGDDALLGEVLNQIACALFLTDDVRCLAVAYQALDVCDELNPPHPDLTARTLRVLGMIFFRLQDWRRAIRCYRRALQATGTELGLRNTAMIHDQLGQTYQRVGRFGDALHHSRLALRMHRRSMDPTDLFRGEVNLGETLLKQGLLRAARPYLERALELSVERGIPRNARAFALLTIAELELSCGNSEAADGHLTTALPLIRELGERNYEASALRLRGRFHFQRGEFEDGDLAFQRAAKMFAELELPVDVLDVQAEHFAGLRAQGRREEALTVAEGAMASGQAALRRVEGGWAEVVVAKSSG